jgi:hypothetical protein
VRHSNPNPVFAGLQGVSEFDRAPRFTLTTFRDYEMFARVYAAYVAPMAAVTPQIREQADRITDGTRDRRDQARRIYQWVAGHIRYVAVELGQGGIIPHSADSVLRNGYGDCKDHAVLFEALLRAKGIESNMVIVNSADTYTVPSVPDFAPFNHVITWLPEFKMYADTTNGNKVPFGLLPRSEYGKPAIHVGDPQGALRKIPLADAGASSDRYQLTIRMDDAGHMESESSSTATGDFAGALRTIGGLIQGENGKSFAMALLAKSSMPHASGAFIAPPPDLDEAEYHIAATYAPPEPLLPLAAGTSFKMGDNLQLVDPFGPNFYGVVADPRYAKAEPLPCFSGRSLEDKTLQFPATRHVAQLPADAGFSTAHTSYSAHWSQTATSISVHRQFQARFDTAVCDATVRDEVQGALARIKADDAAATFALPRN